MPYTFSKHGAVTVWSRSRRAAVIASTCLAFIPACSTSELLEVDLDVITPASAQSASGALALRAAAIRDFSSYFASGTAAWAFVGAVTDELITARPGFEVLDLRLLPEGVTTNPWSSFSATHYSTPTAVRAMRQYLPDDANRRQYIGHVQTLFGFSLTMAGEIFCNGVPLSEKQEDGTLYYDPHMYSNADLWNMAVAYFDSALAGFAATDSYRSLARIGKARALLNLGKFNEAAALVKAGGDGATSAAVPLTYVYNVEYSASANANGIADWLPNSANFGVPKTPEGINGLNWDADPRIGVGAQPLRMGQDGVTPAYMPTKVSWTLTTSSPVPLATGQEARLIEAEADLKSGGSNWLTLLNQIRQGSSLASQLPNLTDPGTANARLDLVMKERAMWMYLTAHRLGDLRRLVRQYGRAQDQVFPTGPYFKGGLYGTDVNVPPSINEHNNPEYEKAGGRCTDRSA